MQRAKVPDPDKLVGKLNVKESLVNQYGFDIVDLNLRKDNEDIEDIALRCLKHSLVLEGGVEAIALRKHRDFFIHQVLNAGLGVATNSINVIFEIIEYNRSTNRLTVYIRTPCNYLNQRVPAMHAFDVTWGKIEVNNTVKLFWDSRGSNHQYVVNTDNTIGCMSLPDIVLGCDEKGQLVLVNKTDLQRRFIFKDLFGSLTWRLNHRLETFRMKNITSLKKNGFLTDWMEPGTSERRMPGRSLSFEIMGRLIHELINFGQGSNLLAGDAYFGSRIDRCSVNELEFIERKEEGAIGGAYNIAFTFTCNMFEKCVIRVNTKHKYIQYIASQFYEVNLEIASPENMKFDISKGKQRNTSFIHQILFADFTSEADTAKDDPTLPVFFEEIILEEKDVKYIQNFNQQNNTSFSEKAYFIKWVGKMEHAFDIQEGKLEENKQILLFWNHRGRNQQFCIDHDQETLHPLGKFELAWGCRDDALKLVPRSDPSVLKFSNLDGYLKKEKKVGDGRMREIAFMSRATVEWDSPVVMAYGIFASITETALTL